MGVGEWRDQGRDLVHMLSQKCPVPRKRWQLFAAGAENSTDVLLVNAMDPAGQDEGRVTGIRDAPSSAGERTLGPLGTRQGGSHRNPGERRS